MKNNLYKTDNWKALQEVRKQKDDIDDAVSGWFIGAFVFIFLSISICKLIVYFIK